MKDKIYRFIGGTVVSIIKFAIGIAIVIVVATGVFESQRDEMFFQVMRVFDGMYQAREEMILEDYGIVDEDEVDQEDHDYQIVNISDTGAQEPAPKIVEEITILCINKHMSDDPKDQTIDEVNDVKQCIGLQLNDAIVIAEVYMKEVSELPKGPTKTILQAIVVECHNGNEIKDQGITDYSGTLQCIKADMGKLKEMLDSEMSRIKTKNGV